MPAQVTIDAIIGSNGIRKENAQPEIGEGLRLPTIP
jgi:hypothetical protein